MLAHDGVDEDPCREVAGERHDQRRHGAAPEHPDQRQSAECEERVAEDDGALGVEDAVVHAALDAHERRAPPGHRSTSTPRPPRAAPTASASLVDQPAAAGDALRPGQPVGPALELEHERRGEQRRRSARAATSNQAMRSPRPSKRARNARPPAAGTATSRAVHAGRDARRGRTRWPCAARSGRSTAASSASDRGGDQRLGALLAPADPGHRATASAARRLAP